MYKVKRGTVKVNGKDYLPGQSLPELDFEDIKSLLAEKLIEEADQGSHTLANFGVSVAADKLEEYSKGLEDNAILKVVTNDGQVESVVFNNEDEPENFHEDADAEGFNVDFNIDDYVAAEPEKALEEKPKDEHKEKKANYKKGGK
jgi:hypothetical protein